MRRGAFGVGEGDIGKQYRALYFPIITERRAYARGGWRVLSARVCFFFSKLPEGKNALDRHPGGGVLLPDTVPLL